VSTRQYPSISPALPQGLKPSIRPHAECWGRPGRAVQSRAAAALRVATAARRCNRPRCIRARRCNPPVATGAAVGGSPRRAPRGVPPAHGVPWNTRVLSGCSRGARGGARGVLTAAGRARPGRRFAPHRTGACVCVSVRWRACAYVCVRACVRVRVCVCVRSWRTKAASRRAAQASAATAKDTRSG
jgi:hypothetical protein